MITLHNKQRVSNKSFYFHITTTINSTSTSSSTTHLPDLLTIPLPQFPQNLLHQLLPEPLLTATLQVMALTATQMEAVLFTIPVRLPMIAAVIQRHQSRQHRPMTLQRKASPVLNLLSIRSQQPCQKMTAEFIRGQVQAATPTHPVRSARIARPPGSSTPHRSILRQPGAGPLFRLRIILCQVPRTLSTLITPVQTIRRVPPQDRLTSR